MLIRILLLTALVALAALACSDKNEPTGPVQQAPQLADYLWFDTTSILRISSGIDNPGVIYYVDGDSIIGEPFGDANGNGVYDPGVDTFIRALDPAVNQDFNHNGTHDGPNDPYYVGEPYEDYNQNGVYDQPDQRYNVGEPFYDRNDNGVLDFVPRRVVYGRWHHDSTGATYCWHYCDSIAAWTSPLGERFVFPDRKWEWDFHRNENLRHPYVNFHWGSDGLRYEDHAGWSVPLADTGNLVTADTTVTMRIYGFDYFARRTTEVGQSLEIDSTLYDDLLRIRLDSFTTDSVLWVTWYYYDFYFSKDYGLLAASWCTSAYGSDPNYFQRDGAYDTLPRPMIRDTITPQP